MGQTLAIEVAKDVHEVGAIGTPVSVVTYVAGGEPFECGSCLHNLTLIALATLVVDALDIGESHQALGGAPHWIAV